MVWRLTSYLSNQLPASLPTPAWHRKPFRLSYRDEERARYTTLPTCPQHNRDRQILSNQATATDYGARIRGYSSNLTMLNSFDARVPVPRPGRTRLHRIVRKATQQRVTVAHPSSLSLHPGSLRGLAAISTQKYIVRCISLNIRALFKYHNSCAR